MSGKKEYIKPQTNIPVTVLFKYENGMAKKNNYQGREYTSYLCGVYENGIEKYLDIPEPAYRDLKSQYGNLANQTLVVTKVEEGRNKRWVFTRPGGVPVQEGLKMAQQAATDAGTPYNGRVRSNPPMPPAEPPMTGSFSQIADEVRTPQITGAYCPLLKDTCRGGACAWAVLSSVPNNAPRCALRVIAENR